MSNNKIKFLVLGLLLISGCYLSLFFGGSESIDLNNPSSDFIFWEIRFPKTITAIIAGCALAVSGLILQIIFRNPLAGPYVLGISSGAALMVSAGMLAGSSLHLFTGYFTGKSLIVALAVTGSFSVTFLILFISKKVTSNVVLLLIGLMFAQICGAIQAALEYFSDPNNLKNFVIWGMGSLANTSNSDLLIFGPSTLLCLSALLFFVKPLNALLLGQNYTHNAGINFTKARFNLILISSLLTGLATAFCGPLAFIGTAVPILSRMIFNSSRQQMHIASCLFLGSILLLFSDVVCNAVMENISLPVNMITTLIGAPLVIYLMFKNKHW